MRKINENASLLVLVLEEGNKKKAFTQYALYYNLKVCCKFLKILRSLYQLLNFSSLLQISGTFQSHIAGKSRRRFQFKKAIIVINSALRLTSQAEVTQKGCAHSHNSLAPEGRKKSAALCVYKNGLPIVISPGAPPVPSKTRHRIIYTRVRPNLLLLLLLLLERTIKKPIAS
jgi:hypothetical protein